MKYISLIFSLGRLQLLVSVWIECKNASAKSEFRCIRASSARLVASAIFYVPSTLRNYYSTSENEQSEKDRINNIKHVQLWLKKISSKVCNWQSFLCEIIMVFRSRRNIIITFGCVHFAQEKYLIIEFMYMYLLPFFCPQLLSCGCYFGSTSRKYGSFQQFGKMHCIRVNVCGEKKKISGYKWINMVNLYVWSYIFSSASSSLFFPRVSQKINSIVKCHCKFNKDKTIEKMKCWK